MAASSASSREFNLDKSGLGSPSIDGTIVGDSGVAVRLRGGLCVVSSFESLRAVAFLPVLFVTKY